MFLSYYISDAQLFPTYDAQWGIRDKGGGHPLCYNVGYLAGVY